MSTTGQRRPRAAPACPGLQLPVLGERRCPMDLPQGIVWSNVERKSKFKRFKQPVSNTSLVTLHQMTIKHLQAADGAVKRAGVEVSPAFSNAQLVGCSGAKAPHPVKSY